MPLHTNRPAAVTPIRVVQPIPQPAANAARADVPAELESLWTEVPTRKHG